ncbi:HD-GYP domain-containing protein [Mesobacillus subterraneus]|uniref:HD-GYP domain-containing protein n=1 Tax=Mesobacillus subterraneus TaxID=285983 RepID=UPI00203A4A40|nr:HD-GYP domain-containing protein [Mesobacillus subterraneus]MCM3664436.1 HD-GYP domain-containing protein [Mesobacillus subterraneus]MCM3684047.1 HD-GYP domain-containing protein [Mesobacillus subterraneus]
MRVNVDNLKEGCILTDDVLSKTNRPIMSKKTVLSNQLIDILKIFLVKEVEVEKTLVNGMPFNAPAIGVDIKAGASTNSADYNFIDLFLRTKQDFKKEFISWQSGMQIDIAKLRGIIVPLIEQTDINSSDIFHLHHYSTKTEYLYDHPLAVGITSAFIAKKLNYGKGDVTQIALAGCLSDCGMAKISPNLLNKKTTLTVEEFEEIKKHPTYSYQMVKNSPLLKDGAKIAILHHHERLDGSGYPFGEKANRIHPFAKILAVADSFHAMTSERIYKPKHSPFKVLEMINEELFGEFDITALKALSSAIMNFSIGSKIRLSDGQAAEIIFVEEKNPARPLVRLVDSDEILALEKNRHLHIEEIIQ